MACSNQHLVCFLTKKIAKFCDLEHIQVNFRCKFKFIALYELKQNIKKQTKIKKRLTKNKYLTLHVIHNQLTKKSIP